MGPDQAAGVPVRRGDRGMWRDTRMEGVGEDSQVRRQSAVSGPGLRCVVTDTKERRARLEDPDQPRNVTLGAARLTEPHACPLFCLATAPGTHCAEEESEARRRKAQEGPLLGVEPEPRRQQVPSQSSSCCRAQPSARSRSPPGPPAALRACSPAGPVQSQLPEPVDVPACMPSSSRADTGLRGLCPPPGPPGPT